MREKMIGYCVGCCFVLGVIYLKNKVFNKKLVVEEIEKELPRIQVEEDKKPE